MIFGPDDAVNHPAHYTQHPSGVECITITEHMSFCVGNAIKYLWRADLKNGIEDPALKAGPSRISGPPQGGGSPTGPRFTPGPR